MKTPFKNTYLFLASASVLVLLPFLVSCAKEAADSHDGHAHDDESHMEDSEQASNDDTGAHEGEGEHVELTEQQFQSAGIEVLAAESGQVAEAMSLSGTIAPNADAVLHVTPRVSGQVRSVAKHLGDFVEPGDLLCILDSVELGRAAAEFLRDKAMLEAAEETLVRERELYQGRLASLTLVLQGSIEIQQRILEREQELQQKAVSTIRPLLEAQKSYQLALLEKDMQLTELEAERDARLLELEVSLRSERIAVTAAANRLTALGLSMKDIESLDGESPLLSGEYKIFSPGEGIIVNRHVSVGEFAESGTKLFVVEDLSDVWFIASAFEDQLLGLRGGQSASIAIDAFPGITLNGKVDLLDYHVDPTSRSVGVRITLANEQLDNWSEELPLRPGMFGKAEIETASWHAAIVLPEKALVHEDAGAYVFVQVEPLGFERRDVEVRHAAAGMVEILSGVEQGEMVAIAGTFLLKSAERQAELGGGHSH